MFTNPQYFIGLKINQKKENHPIKYQHRSLHPSYLCYTTYSIMKTQCCHT